MSREPAAWRGDDVASPCISVCTLDATQTYCTGCLRTLHEIATWSRMSADDKRAVIDALAARRDRTEAR
ncbi:MAG: DUF1289 domain-containing protein [Burkholderiales bacterium]